jgi:hypothetical protein
MYLSLPSAEEGIPNSSSSSCTSWGLQIKGIGPREELPGQQESIYHAGTLARAGNGYELVVLAALLQSFELRCISSLFALAAGSESVLCTRIS